MRARRQAPAAGGAQDYLASVSDLMSGLIFIFIITLAVFALRLAQAQQQAKTKEDEFTSAKERREEIVRDIERQLQQAGLMVEIDPEYGVVHLTDEVIGFDLGKDEPRADHRQNVATVARVLGQVLRCYVETTGMAPAVEGCGAASKKAKVDTVMIEGHTDSAPILGGDNLDLSAARSARILRLFEQDAPELTGFRNFSGKPVMSVSGYADLRPRNTADTRAPENRRIDLRFIMELPRKTSAADPPPVTDTREAIER